MLDAAIMPLRVAATLGQPDQVEVLIGEERSRVRALGRKWTKAEAIYVPLAPPPGAWRYQCGTCAFFQAGAPPMCETVGQPGDPWGGEAIHPLHWCARWIPQAGDRPLRWLAEWLSLPPVRGEL